MSKRDLQEYMRIRIVDYLTNFIMHKKQIEKKFCSIIEPKN